MANLSAIKLPNGTTYTLKDNGALQLTGGQVTGPVTFGDSVSIDEATIGDLIVNGNTSFVQGVKTNQIVPFKSKTFTDVIGTANNWAGATFFFGSIKPTTWYALWKIKFNIYIYVPGKDTYHQISEVMISGDQGTLRTYSSMNTVANQLVYYGVLYRLKSAGFTNGYGHSIGCRFYSSNYPTDTNYKRTIIVDILETENCTFDFYDSCLLYANIPGTGTTNYDTYSEINWCSNGLQEAGDADTTDDRQIYFGGKTSASKGIWAGSLFMEDGEGTYQNICAASDGTITASNRTTATTKIANTSGFKIGGKVYYSNTNYGPNTNISGWGVVYNTISLFDTRYAFNTTLTTGSLTVYQPLYLVGTISNGLFYLDSIYYTQTPTDTGKIYILVGGVYDSTTSNCRMGLYQHNPWYYYDGSKLVPYVGNAQTINGHTINADVPSGAKFTDTKVNMIARDTTKSYLLGTTTAPTSSNQAVSSVAETGVYFDTTAGTLVATTFKGKLIGNVAGNVSGSAQSVAWSGIVSKPTTISGYGITDAKIASGVITLGGHTITPLTSSSTINAAKLSGIIPGNVTAITQASTNNSTKIATTAYVTTAIANLPEPMIFKGSVGTDGTITSLPTATTENEGWTYKVITALSDPTAKIGDTVISDGSSWVVIPSGTDEKLKVDAITSSGTYYPVLSTDLTTAETKKYDEFFSFAHENGTEAYIGIGKLNTAVGRIRLYTTASGGKYGIITPGTLSATRTYTLPDNTGTIALTSDISPLSSTINTIDDRTKTYIYDQSTGSFLDWVTTTFTNNGEYYVIFATTNYTGWINSNLGTCLIQKRNADYYLTAFVNDTTITDSQTFYLNKYVGNAWSGWSKMPTRTEMDILTAAHCNITGIASGTAPSAFVKWSLENDKLPYDTTFVARFSAGYYFWGIGHFYKVSNQVYGSAIVSRPNYMCKVNCYADTWTEETISTRSASITYKFENLAQYSSTSYYLTISGIKAKAGIPSSARVISASIAGWTGLGTNPAVELISDDSMYVFFTSGISITSSSYVTVRFIYES